MTFEVAYHIFVVVEIVLLDYSRFWSARHPRALVKVRGG